jgi:manganese/zinc/iron transport system substrate-binding protein
MIRLRQTAISKKEHTMQRLRQCITLLILILIVVGGVRVTAQANVLKIVTTTTQATDLTTIIAGELVGQRVQITPLMGAGVDPHLYKPTEADIQAMNQADLVIYSGLHLEGQFDRVFDALGQRAVRVYALADPVKAAGYIIGGFDLSDELTGVDDPHFWFDPRNWQIAAEGLAQVLSQTDPDHAEIYTANAAAYSADLDLIYEWALDAMSQVPESQRVLVTSHDAFQYFGDAFGWQVRGLQGISTEDEAGVADVQAIAQFVTDNRIPVIFVESSVPPNAIRAVQEAVNANGGEVRIGVRELYSDAMGDPGTFAGTYIGMIGENVLTILQSYQLAGIELEIPGWPDALEPVMPAELWEIQA